MTALLDGGPSAPTHHDSAATLDRLTAGAACLYSLPTVAMRVLELTNNPVVDAHALKECIEYDPALTGKLLRVVNSSLFGLARHVSDLNQALALLGTKPLKMLVLGFSLPNNLFASATVDMLARYWRHTLTKAVIGRELSQQQWHQPGDDAFIAGLLQDLGQLLLIEQLGEPYVRLLEAVATRGADLASLERQAMGFAHTMLTARLLEQWGLPDALVEAIAWQPPDDLAGESPLPQIVYLAELLTRCLAAGQSSLLSTALDFGRRACGLDRSQLDTLVERLDDKVGQLADVLQLQLPGGIDYQDVLLRAHAQLSTVAEEAAVELLHKSAGGIDPARDAALQIDFHALAEAVGRAARSPRRLPAAKGGPRPASERPAGDAPPPQPANDNTAAADDPLRLAATSADDAALLQRLTATAAACRQRRCALSLLLFSLHGTGRRPAGSGAESFGPLVEQLCHAVDQPGCACTRRSATEVAVVLPDCERRAAVELGNQLILQTRRWSAAQADDAAPPKSAVALCVGVATVALPPKNFLPQSLLAAANRCLYGSHASSGNVVKSIEIY